MLSHSSINISDSMLLEQLCQLTLSDQKNGPKFEQLSIELDLRLHQYYDKAHENNAPKPPAASQSLSH